MTTTQPQQSSMARRTGYAQVAAKADSDILKCRLKGKLAQDTIIAATAEIDQLDAQLKDIREALEYTRRVQAQLATTLEQARNYATTSVGTLAEQEARAKLREAEKQFNHRAELTQGLVDKDKEETPRLLARKFDLQLSISDARTTIAQAEQELRAAEQVKAQSWRELGEAECDEHLKTLSAFDAQINDLRAQIVEHEAKRTAYLEEQALPALQDWPEHVRALGKLRRRDDAFTAGLEGLCKTLEAMIAYPHMFPPNLSTFAYPTARWSGGELSQLTAIPIEELRAAARGNDTLLKQRLARCQALLNEARGVER